MDIVQKLFHFSIWALFVTSLGAAPSLAAADNPSDQVSSILPPWKLRGPSDWARVYIDSSGSMLGFIGKKGGPQARFFRRLKDILVESQVLNFEAAQFGLKVQPAVKVAAFEKFGLDRRFYTQGDTYLAGVIEDAISWKRNGVTLVLTDGVSSVTKFHGEAAGPSARTCTLGSDTACLALRIREYVEKGHGFWIVGFRFPFDGPYFVEEGGPKANPGTKLESVKVPDRPFYIWVGAADIKQGRAIVSGLLRFSREAEPPIPTMAIEVAPGLWDRWHVPPDVKLEELSLPRREFCPRGGGLLKSFRARERGAEFSVMEVATRDKGSFPVQVPVRGEQETQKSEMLSLLYFAQELGLSLPTTLSPDKVSLKWSLQSYQGSKKNRSYSLDLCVTGRPPQVLMGKDIDVVAQWKGRRAIAAEAPWETWSTDRDDTPEASRRTVNLSIFFRHLLSQMMPEFGDRASPVTSPETILRILYRK